MTTGSRAAFPPPRTGPPVKSLPAARFARARARGRTSDRPALHECGARFETPPRCRGWASEEAGRTRRNRAATRAAAKTGAFRTPGLLRTREAGVKKKRPEESNTYANTAYRVERLQSAFFGADRSSIFDLRFAISGAQARSK